MLLAAAAQEAQAQSKAVGPTGDLQVTATADAAATGSAVLRTFNDTLKAIADGAVVGVKYTSRRHAAVAAAHERVMAALRAHDAVAAESAMQVHVEEAGTYWRRHYPNLTSGGVRWIS